MQSITCVGISYLPALVSTQSCCLGKLHSRSLNTILAQGWLKCHLVVCRSFVAWITSLPPRMISFGTSSVYLTLPPPHPCLLPRKSRPNFNWCADRVFVGLGGLFFLVYGLRFFATSNPVPCPPPGPRFGHRFWSLFI